MQRAGLFPTFDLLSGYSQAHPTHGLYQILVRYIFFLRYSRLRSLWMDLKSWLINFGRNILLKMLSCLQTTSSLMLKTWW